jgi:hypothetical protein
VYLVAKLVRSLHGRPSPKPEQDFKILGFEEVMSSKIIQGFKILGLRKA